MYRFKKFSLSLIMLLIGMASIGVQHGWCASGLPPLDMAAKLRPASQSCSYNEMTTVSIGGLVFEGYYRFCDKGFVTFRVPSGYSVFDAHVGLKDSSGTNEGAVFQLLVDGDEVERAEVLSKQKPVHWSVGVSAGQSVQVVAASRKANMTSCPVLADPKFLASAIVQPLTGFKCPVCGRIFDRIDDRDAHVKAEHGGTPPTAVSGASFVVDPNDMEKLATALRKRVDGKPELKNRIAGGQVALMTFTLVDIPSKSVAVNVAENLSTSLINADFPLVERGQLDKVLNELKFQDTGVIDPTTAQKIGKLTGCDAILVGSIADMGQFVVINTRLLDTSTGKALAAERVEMRKIPISR